MGNEQLSLSVCLSLSFSLPCLFLSSLPLPMSLLCLHSFTLPVLCCWLSALLSFLLPFIALVAYFLAYFHNSTNVLELANREGASSLVPIDANARQMSYRTLVQLAVYVYPGEVYIHAHIASSRALRHCLHSCARQLRKAINPSIALRIVLRIALKSSEELGKCVCKKGYQIYKHTYFVSSSVLVIGNPLSPKLRYVVQRKLLFCISFTASKSFNGGTK